MSSWSRVALSTLFAVATLLFGSSALAQQPIDAAFEHGRTLRAEHRDAEALEVFRRLFVETHQPRAQAQVGLAEGALGQWVSAERDVAAALATAGDPWIAQNRLMLDSAAATIRTHLGELELSCNAPHCEVWIGDQVVGSVPSDRPLRVVAGTVNFEVRAPGYGTEVRVATVPSAGVARESVVLMARAAVAVTSPTTPTPTPPRAQRSTPTGLVLGVVGTIVGAGLVGAGVGLYVFGAGEASAYNNDSTCPGSAQASQPTGCQGHLNSASLGGGLALGGFVVGGALAVVGVVLIVTGATNSSSEHRSAGAVACGSGPGLVGVSCDVRF